MIDLRHIHYQLNDAELREALLDIDPFPPGSILNLDLEILLSVSDAMNGGTIMKGTPYHWWRTTLNL